METVTLQTDYLIIGSGAVGMAFADVLLTESDANMVIVDRYAKPGGHWNAAYPFVQLHQPSQFYGVSSRELSQCRLDGFSQMAKSATGNPAREDLLKRMRKHGPGAVMNLMKLDEEYKAAASG